MTDATPCTPSVGIEEEELVVAGSDEVAGREQVPLLVPSVQQGVLAPLLAVHRNRRDHPGLKVDDLQSTMRPGVVDEQDLVAPEAQKVSG